jgi:hypothetical protein
MQLCANSKALNGRLKNRRKLPKINEHTQLLSVPKRGQNLRFGLFVIGLLQNFVSA